MPDHFDAENYQDDAEDALNFWREPPGYLGEAVRRAKQIARRARTPEPPPAP